VKDSTFHFENNYNTFLYYNNKNYINIFSVLENNTYVLNAYSTCKFVSDFFYEMFQLMRMLFDFLVCE